MCEHNTPSSSDVSRPFYSLVIAVENTMGWIYRTAAGLVNNKEVAELLERMAKAEAGHAQVIAKAYPDLAAAMEDGDEPSDWTVSRFYKAIIPELDISEPRSLLVTAYRIERGGQAICKRWVDEALSEESRKLAEFLLKQEIAHQTAVAARFESLFGTSIDDEPGASKPIEWPEIELAHRS